MKKIYFLLFFLFLFNLNIYSIETDDPIVGDQKAKKGGKITVTLYKYPKSLMLYLSHDLYSHIIDEFIFDALCEYNYKSGKLVPRLATKWDISKDKLKFTYYLNKKARFADGKPVTAHDVKFTFDTIVHPKHLTGPYKVLMSDKFKEVNVIDDYTVEFIAKKVHYNNLEESCDTYILPKHFFSKGDFNKSFNEKLMGSGPYKLGKIKRGQLIELVRRPDYWGYDLNTNKGRFNFDKILYKIVEDNAVSYELFKNGEIDVYFFETTAETTRWINETNDAKYKNNWILKKKVENSTPRGTQGYFFNMRKPLFKDVKVRLAMAHLLNRDKIINELLYNEYTKLSSYFPNSIYSNLNLKPIEYDPKKAMQLLKEAGWYKTDKDGVLLKDNIRFEFDFTYASKADEKYLTIFKEDLKKVGIKMNLKLTTWPTLVKQWDTFDFDVSTVSWTGVMSPDPRQLWHSETANIESTSNMPGFANTEADTLIESLAPIFDVNKRARIIQKIDEIVFNTHPYILSWFRANIRMAFWNKFGYVEEFVPKFLRGEYSIQYFWYDEEKAKALTESMKNNKPLAAK
jgi:microcin C transport system substrate-binding protein